MTQPQGAGGLPPLSATHVIEYPYQRSLGPALRDFFTGLRAHRILGARTPGGRVIVPPAEYDPETGAATDPELVEVGPGGAIRSFTWVTRPRPQHPFDRPFAFALVRLDGADSDLLHVVDAPELRLATGLRVVPRWRAESEGGIQDLECFVPEEDAS